MFLDSEITDSFTFCQILLALLLGVAPIAITIVIKVVLYRRVTADKASTVRDGGTALPKQDRRRRESAHI